MLVYIHFFYRKNMQNPQMAVLQDAEVCNKYTTMHTLSRLQAWEAVLAYQPLTPNFTQHS